MEPSDFPFHGTSKQISRWEVKCLRLGILLQCSEYGPDLFVCVGARMQSFTERPHLNISTVS